jgi:tripartite-type tricarboxylate transporter receptor subunit TctC
MKYARFILQGMAMLLIALPVHAQTPATFPAKVVRIVVPSTSGGGADLLARMLAHHLSERWGRQVVVENRTGASNMIGGEFVAKSAPDGHTLLAGISTLAINPATFKKVPYDAQRDFAPITHMVSIPNILMVHPSLPAKNATELAAVARARPGQLLYGSGGHGTNNHLVVELFGAMTGTKMTHVPYKNSGPAMVDTVGGHLMVFATNMILGLPHTRNGRLRAIGVTSLQRASGAGEIPTLHESGLPGFEAVQWYGLLAPAATPRDITDKIYRDASAVLKLPEVRDRLNADGAMVVASSSEQFAAFIKSETVKWAKVVKAAGIVPE